MQVRSAFKLSVVFSYGCYGKKFSLVILAKNKLFCNFTLNRSIGTQGIIGLPHRHYAPCLHHVSFISKIMHEFDTDGLVAPNYMKCIFTYIKFGNEFGNLGNLCQLGYNNCSGFMLTSKW